MLRVLELFGGIGACTSALKRLKIEYKIIDYVDNDKYAVASYNAINETNFITQDIRQYNKDIEADLIMHGSPCQDFSLAGKQAGGDENSQTRSSLMYETVRIVEKIKPKYVIWENVKNLLSQKHRHNFENYLEKMKKLGYENHYQILNAKDYGIPQNRERVFTISIRSDLKKDFKFPEKEELKLKLKDLLENQVDEKYFLSDKGIKYVEKRDGGYTQIATEQTEVAHCPITAKGNDNWTGNFIKVKNATKKGYQEATNGDSVNLTYPESKTRRGRVGKQVAQTIQCNENIGVIDKSRIRKLTPQECWRLMGFTDEEFKKAEQVNSNTQLYKQAGNSIVVNVLVKILENLLRGE